MVASWNDKFLHHGNAIVWAMEMLLPCHLMYDLRLNLGSLLSVSADLQLIVGSIKPVCLVEIRSENGQDDATTRCAWVNLWLTGNLELVIPGGVVLLNCVWEVRLELLRQDNDAVQSVCDHVKERQRLKW